jgi:hypothetical protein
MGEAKEREGLRTPQTGAAPSQGRQPAELDQPRLVRVERQAKLRQTLSQGDPQWVTWQQF